MSISNLFSKIRNHPKAVIAAGVMILGGGSLGYMNFSREAISIGNSLKREAARGFISEDTYWRYYTLDKASQSKAVKNFDDHVKDEIFRLMDDFWQRRKVLAAQLDLEANVKLEDLPPEVDWRKRGGVTAVKPQTAKCGSCWAFAVAGAMEGLGFINTGKLVELSPQQLIDCGDPKDGCNGGHVYRSFDYLKRNGGITTERNYPYVAKKCPCNHFKEKQIEVEVTKDFYVLTATEGSLRRAVAVQPVIVLFNADESSFSDYIEGVLLPGDYKFETNHAALLIGYGVTEKGMKYWLLKGSEGPDFGEEGYYRLLRGEDEDEGFFGLARFASFPRSLPPKVEKVQELPAPQPEPRNMPNV